MSDFAVTRVDEPVKDDYTWAASSHGMHTGFSVTLNVGAFTEATHYPDGYVPSGTPIRDVGGRYEPTVVTTAPTYDAVLLSAVPVSAGQVNAVGAAVDHVIVHGDRLRGASADAAPAAGSGIVVR